MIAPTRLLGRLATALVIAGTLTTGRALPQTPQSPAAAPAAATSAEKRVKFEFNNKPWKQVFEWLSDQTGLMFTGINIPPGSFTFIAPKGSVGATQGFTIPEVIDSINEALLAAPPNQRWQLVRREQTFTLIPADEKPDPILVPRVTADELAKRGNTEIVSLVFQLSTLVAEDYAPEVKRMLGPFGEVTVLAKSNQLLLQDSVKSLRNIIKTTEDVEKKEGGANETFAHTCVYIKARDAERTLIAQMGDPKILLAQQLQQMQPQRDPRDGRVLPPAQPAQKIRMFYISADERTETVYVTGPADKIAQARDIMKKIDVPNPPGQKEPQLQRFPVPEGTATDIATMLRTQVFRGSTLIQVQPVGTNQIMVYAPPADLMAIAGILEGGARGSTNVVKLIPVNTLDASDAASTLTKMFPQDAKTGVGPVVEADTTRNAVRAKGSREQVEDIEMALKAIDMPSAAGATWIANIEHGSAAQMAIILQKALEARGTPAKVITTAPQPVPGTTSAKPATSGPTSPMNPGTTGPGSPNTNTPMPGSGNGGGDVQPQQQPPANPNAKPVTITAIGNRLIINTDDADTRRYIQEVIRTMTQPGGEGDFEIIRLTNANATDTARVIDEFYNGPKQGGPGGGTVLERLRGGGFPGGGFGFPGGMQQPGGAPTTTVTPKVRVVADPGSNALIVRATPLEMASIRDMVKALDGGEEAVAAQKVNRIKLQSANVSEVAYVIESLYHDLLGTGSRNTSVGGFSGFAFGGISGFGGRGNSLLRSTDANGNVRPNPLSIGVDERTNTLLVLASEALFKQIKTLVEELDKESAGYVKSVKVVQIKGVDPTVVQQAIDMFQGQQQRNMMSGMGRGMGGMGMGGFGNGGFGGRGFGNGGFGNGFGGSPFGGGGFGNPYGGFGGGNFGGGFGGRGMGNFGGGMGNFGGGMGNFGGGNFGGPGGGGPGGGGRGSRGGGGPGGGAQRTPNREPGGPDFFEYGVMEDPQPSQLFDPQRSETQWYGRPSDNRMTGFEEQQQPPAPPPAGQPMQPAPQPPQTPGGQPPTAPGANPAAAPPKPDLTQPRRPVFVEALPELGIVVISGDNPDDIAAIEAIIATIQRIAKGSEAKIEIVPLQYADATSVAATLSQVYARILTSPSGNILIPSSGPRAAVQSTTTGPLGTSQTGTTAGATAAANNAAFIPLPRFNALLIAAQEARLPDIKSEIAKLDKPNGQAGMAVPFQLTRASAPQVATLLTQFYASRYPGEATAQNQVRITYDTNTNTVFVQAGPADLEEIRALIQRIDSTVSAATNDLRIVRLKNTISDELANTLVTAITAGVLPPGTTAAPGVVPTAAAAAVRPAVTGAAAPAGGGLTTKTTSLRFFSNRPGPNGVIEAGVLEDVHITSELRSNSLIVAAPPKTMDLILALIQELDVTAAAQASLNIFTLRKADAVQTATLLQQLIQGAGTTGAATGAGTLGGPTFAPNAGAAPAGGLARPIITLAGLAASAGAPLIDLRLTVDNRTNSIIVAGSTSDLQVVEAIIARLEDVNVPTRQSQVYRLKNQAAADVANALQTFITNALSVPRTANQITSFQEIQRDVVIVPEPISNTLLISATPQYFTELYRLIEQMDQMPPQVVIQVMVAEVILDDDQEFGVEFGLQSPVLFNRSLFTAAGGTTAATPNVGTPAFNFNSTAALPNSANFSPGVVGVQGLGNLNVGRVSPNGNAGGFIFSAQSDSFSLLIRALKTQSRLDVLSRPQVTTLDNQTAAVSIGQDIPIVSSSSVTATGLVTTSVDRRNVGVLLRVTPRITPDGKVLMRVFPEVSSVIPTPVQLGNGVQSTAFNIEQVETSVVAQDGETVVIGGMIQQRDLKNETKVPWLGDLPYVGTAFRYRTQVREKREVLVILTPHVVRCQSDLDRVTAEEAKRMDWMMTDVNRIYGPADLYKITPPQNVVAPQTPAPPPAPLPQTFNFDGTPMDLAPPRPPSGPGGPIAPRIPAGPLLPMWQEDPAVPPKDPPPTQPSAPPPQPGPGQQLPPPTRMTPGWPPAAPGAQPVTPPAPNQAAGPTLTPAVYYPQSGTR
jgi:type II secretion system protein D